MAPSSKVSERDESVWEGDPETIFREALARVFPPSKQLSNCRIKRLSCEGNTFVFLLRPRIPLYPGIPLTLCAVLTRQEKGMRLRLGLDSDFSELTNEQKKPIIVRKKMDEVLELEVVEYEHGNWMHAAKRNAERFGDPMDWQREEVKVYTIA